MEYALQLGAIFGTAFVVGLSGAMMPGPLLAVTIHEATRSGARAGPVIMLGHMLLEAALVAAVALGLARWLTDRRVISVVSFIGGAMMCWMGPSLIRSARHASLQAPSGNATRLHPVAAGVLVSLSNPYWTIWWATIGLGYVVMGLKFGLVGLMVFFAGHILSDFAWYTLVSVGVAKGRRILSDRIYRGMIAVCGAALLGFGAWFFWTGWSEISG